MPTVKEVFDGMQKGFDKEEAGDWEAIIQYAVEGDGGGNWVMSVKDGTCAVVEGTNDAATATLETDAETWIGIADGSVGCVAYGSWRGATDEGVPSAGRALGATR